MSVVVGKMKELSKEQLEKYGCSTFLSNIKEEGQLKLLNSKVLVVGAGGLGSHVLPILASSGVGYIGIVDNDVVSLDNLPRQTLYGYKDVGKSKVLLAKKKLNFLNPDIEVKTYKLYLDKNNARRVLKNYDIIVDCTDNFATKFLINDTCLKLKIPFVCAGVSDYKGQVMTCIPNKSKDFKSLFSEPPLNIDQKYIDEDKGVFPPAVAIIGNIAACEAMKYLLSIDELLLDSLLVVDTLNYSFKKISIKS